MSQHKKIPLLAALVLALLGLLFAGYWYLHGRYFESTDNAYAAGNVVHVHDLVDFVSDEADIAGKFAALEAQGKLAPVAHTVAVKPVDGVRTCVPQVLHLPEGGEDARLFMRVGAPARKVMLQVKCNGEVLVQRMFPVVKPSEMITLDLPAAKTALMDGEITVGLQQK